MWDNRNMRTSACAAVLMLFLALIGSTAQERGLALINPADYDSAFWKIWGDGQAEMSSYDLTEPHYGKPRRGVALTVFVSETFSNSARVKADPGKHPKSDEFPVMKLNLIKDFQTGIYDYNDMTSAFLALDEVNSRKPGTLTKASFSSQEWCGNVYHQLLFDANVIRSSRHSYFDGEGDQQIALPYPANGISADAVFFWARQMAEPKLAPGETRTVPMLTELQSIRDTHRPAEWTQARLMRMKTVAPIRVPAGNFEVEAWIVERPNLKITIYAEKAAPHRIVRWETSRGEKADLLASDRMKYWQMNGPGGESNLKRLKLSPRPPRTT
jgi:hypothetical protein